MYDIMRTNIIKIGNSNGIIIPKGVLKTLGLCENQPVIIEIQSDGMLIKKEEVRLGWTEAAQRMRHQNEDALLMPDLFEDEIIDEW